MGSNVFWRDVLVNRIQKYFWGLKVYIEILSVLNIFITVKLHMYFYKLILCIFPIQFLYFLLPQHSSTVYHQSQPKSKSFLNTDLKNIDTHVFNCYNDLLSIIIFLKVTYCQYHLKVFTMKAGCPLLLTVACSKLFKAFI